MIAVSYIAGALMFVIVTTALVTIGLFVLQLLSAVIRDIRDVVEDTGEYDA